MKLTLIALTALCMNLSACGLFGVEVRHARVAVHAAEAPRATTHTVQADWNECAADAGDSLSGAVAIQPGTIVGCLHGEDRKDFMVLQAAPHAAGVAYVIELEDLTPSGRYRGQKLTLYDQDRQQLSVSALLAVRDNARAKGWVVVAGGSPIYVEVNTRVPGDQTYRLTITPTPIEDVDEPNDGPERAVSVQAGGSYQAFISPALNDPTHREDWYRLDVHEPGTYQVVLDEAPAEVQFEVHAFDADHQKLFRKKSRNDGATLRFEMEVSQPGTTFLQVNHAKISVSVTTFGRGELPEFLTRPYRLTISR